METPNPPALGTPGEYVLRIGEATDPKTSADKSIKIEGTLPAPYDFLLGKDVDEKQCHLLIRKDTGSLELHIKDTDPYTEHVIKGSLKTDNFLTLFRINTETRWGVREFLKFIRPLSFCFADRTQFGKISDSLKVWEAKIETVIKDHQNSSGSSLMVLEKKVSDVKVENKFKLSVPLFQGYPKETFMVEIGFEPTASAVNLYLFSDDLIELEAIKREVIIEQELAKFEDYKFSKVVLS